MNLTLYKRNKDEDYIKEDLDTKKETFDFVRRSEEDLSQTIHSHIDTHIHSKYSLDGYLGVEQIVKRAQENSVDFISITDHNSVMAFHDLMRNENKKDTEIIYNYDGVKVLCGSEVTCYMSVGNGNKIKFHLLCYGFDRSDDSPIMNMISAKYDDYKRSQYKQLYHLAGKNPIYKTSLSEIKDYMQKFDDKTQFKGSFTNEYTIDFYKQKGIPEEQIKKDLGYCQSYSPDQLTLDIVDVINATHDSGGLCSLAHPTISMEKFRLKKNVPVDQFTFFRDVTNVLLFNGLDGIELSNKYKNYDLRYNDYYRDTYLVSSGSDLHYFNDIMYKDIGKYRTDISGVNIDKIMYELESAKKGNRLTDRQKSNQYITYNDTTLRKPYMQNIGKQNRYYTNRNNNNNNGIKNVVTSCEKL